jgi:septal ring factor EnvC (AmiA/AmiB activator)
MGTSHKKPVEKSIGTLISRIRAAFSLEVKAQPSAFVSGGEAVLEIAQRELQESTFFNVHQQLEETQQELEEISFQLSQQRNKSKQLEQQVERLQPLDKARPRRQLRKASSRSRRIPL